MAWRMSTGLKNALLNSGGLREIFENGQIKIFTGPQPASADDAETGQLLCIITLNGEPMTSGVALNGINLGISSGGQVGKSSLEVWSGKSIIDGVAGWFRWYPNDIASNVGLASSGSEKIRIDGSCGTANSQLVLTTTNLKANVPTTIDNVSIKL